METLYELTGSYKQLIAMIDDLPEDTGLDEKQVMADTLDMIADSIEEKAKNICGLRASYEAEAAMYKAEMDRLAKAQQKAKKRADALKEYLGNELLGAGIDKLQAGTFKCAFTLRPVVSVPDVSLIPEEYIRTKITQEPDKVAIKKAINDGAVIPGAELVDNATFSIK